MGNVEYIYKRVYLSVGNAEDKDGKHAETRQILNIAFSLAEDQ